MYHVIILSLLCIVYGQPNANYDALLIDNVEEDVLDPCAVWSGFDGELFVVYIVGDVLKIARSEDDGVSWSVSVVDSAMSGKVFVAPRVAVSDVIYEVVVVVYEKGSVGCLKVWREVVKGKGFVEEIDILSGFDGSGIAAIQDFVYGSGIYALVFAGDGLNLQIIWTKDFLSYSSESISHTKHDYDVVYPSKNYKLQWKEDNYLVLIYSFIQNPAKSYLELYYSNNMDSTTPFWSSHLLGQISAPCAFNVITCSSAHWYIGYQCSGNQGYFTTNNWSMDPVSATWISHSYSSDMEFSLGGGCFNYISYDLVSTLDGTSYKYIAHDFTNSDVSTSTVSISAGGSDSLSFYGFKSGYHKISWVFADPSTYGKERYEGETISTGSNKDLSIFSLIPCIDNAECDAFADMCGKSCITHSNNIKTCQTGTVKNCLFNNRSDCGAVCSAQNCVLSSGVDCTQGDPANCGRVCLVTGVCTDNGTSCTCAGETCKSDGCSGICPTVSETQLTVTLTENQGSTTDISETSSSDPIDQSENTSDTEPGIITTTFNIVTGDKRSYIGLVILFVLLGVTILSALAVYLVFVLRKKEKKYQTEKMELELQRIQQQSQQRKGDNRTIADQYFSGSNPSSSEKN